MKKREVGFLSEAKKFVVVEKHEGLSAQEIVRTLRESGRVSSAADDKQGSLVATLHKHHQQIGLFRRMESGAYRFHISGSSTKNAAGEAASHSDITFTIAAELLSPETLKALKALVGAGRYPSLPTAAAALMDKGRNVPEMQQLLTAYELFTEVAGKV